jgi:hypothetical protein
MIATPATFSSVCRLSDSVLPIPVALIPSRMKIALNVRTNRPARTRTARICTLRDACRSPGASPQTVER